MFFKPERFSVFVERTLHEMNNIGVGIFCFGKDLYFKGKMESSIALTGQVAGRIEKEERKLKYHKFQTHKK